MQVLLTMSSFIVDINCCHGYHETRIQLGQHDIVRMCLKFREVAVLEVTETRAASSSAWNRSFISDLGLSSCSSSTAVASVQSTNLYSLSGSVLRTQNMGLGNSAGTISVARSEYVHQHFGRAYPKEKCHIHLSRM